MHCASSHLNRPKLKPSVSLAHKKLLRPRQLGSVLEMVLQNLRRQSGRHFLSRGFDGADDFSAADHFGRRKPGDLGGQHQIDFQLNVRLEKIGLRIAAERAGRSG